ACKLRLLFSGSVGHMGDERLPNIFMFGEIATRKRKQGGQEKNWLTCLHEDL
ncbi:unnamed protein product, partial [Choristocarpus tenellus]